MKENFYLIILLLGLAGFKSSSSLTISGTVRDQQRRSPLSGVSVRLENSNASVLTDSLGHYAIDVPREDVTLSFSLPGYEARKLKPGKSRILDVELNPVVIQMNEVVVTGYSVQRKADLSVSSSMHGMHSVRGSGSEIQIRGNKQLTFKPFYHAEQNESYKEISENSFQNPKDHPLSTFAVDVDGASYTNLRRFIQNGQLPPKDAVRIEEMINYFKYDMEAPQGNKPVAIHTELSSAPWNLKHQLLRIGLKAKEIKTENLPPANLVFLIDVSGSMNYPNKLPLVKSSLKMLVDQLRNKDRVAIVTYSGYVAEVLKSTPGNQKSQIKQAIDALIAGGGTAGGEGLKMAYRLARENYLPKGNNRIIMATDGDFNIGAYSDNDMEELVTRERESGIHISVLGYGMGNLKDSKMETIADKGRGNYAYIDNLTEARKAMVSEFGGTLFTLAKDVKIQIEFNPAKVEAYRLIGYENRLLAKEDFNNDKKIGGDMGVGHTVTALYEIIPAGEKNEFSENVDPLKYQNPMPKSGNGSSAEIATIKFRYKNPHSDKSELQQVVLHDQPKPFNATSDDFRFASAVAEFGMLLRGSEFKQQSDFSNLIFRAKAARGQDEDGYRAEFARLAESAASLQKSMEVAIE